MSNAVVVTLIVLLIALTVIGMQDARTERGQNMIRVMVICCFGGVLGILAAAAIVRVVG